MKRIAIIVVMALMSLTASATSIRYFTYQQASRTVQYLNAQQELMIYCGYDYEIETYVLINEVWMERVNSAYYEIWVYGFDAYTGDEIYMPLDLQCVWLYSAGRMYNAAQYLRFHATVHTPVFSWYIPPYNPYTRRMHAAGYVRSYHYDVHRHGWMPPAPPHHGYGPHTQTPLPPYYMRTPQTPAPAPTRTWTPGLEHPEVNNSGTRGGNQGGSRSGGAVPSTRPSSSGAATSGTRSGNTRSTGTTGTRGIETKESGTDTRSTGTTRGTGTTPTRTNTTTTRSTGTATTRDNSGNGSESSTSSTTTTTETTTRTGSGTRNTGTTRSTGTTTKSNTTGTRSGSTTRSSENTASNRNAATSTTTNRGKSTTGSRTTDSRTNTRK